MCGIRTIERHLLRVIDVAARFRVVHGRLRVALTAHGDVLLRRQAAEANRRIVRGTSRHAARFYPLDVRKRRPVAHLTIDAGFTKYAARSLADALREL